ncbi:FAD-dependent oxidoreductase, partial [Arthrospira platensis SPKY1]|nr:FAD-dependent oxidoreductase [Arthrospira platensis SPKY1]
KATTRAVFPGLPLDGPLQAWAGLRPATPRGLPLTGRAPGPPENVWLNTGHGALGLTLSMGSAERIRLMLSRPASGRPDRCLPAPAACSA